MKKQSHQCWRHFKRKALAGARRAHLPRQGGWRALSAHELWIRDCESRGYTRATVYRDGRSKLGFIRGAVTNAPANLSFLENYEETAAFLSEIDGSARDFIKLSKRKRAFLNGKNGLIYEKYWDYSSISNITLPVSLVIASHYDRIVRLKGWLPGAINIENWHPGVRSMLQSIGFLELCHVDRQVGDVARVDGLLVRKLRSGGSAAGDAIGAFFDDLGLSSEELDPQIYSGLFEAILNTRNHAYDDSGHANAARLWWLAGALDQATNELIVCVYDHGVSIPVSLTRPISKWPLIQTMRDLWYRTVGQRLDQSDGSQDGLTIALAMQVGKTRTRESNRGKGLPAIENVIDICDAGYVAIRSRRGEYTRRKGEEPIVTTRVAALRGTLVVWRLKLPGLNS